MSRTRGKDVRAYWPSIDYFKENRQIGLTLTTANRFLRFLDTLAIAENTK